jgi:hypothetical protein
MLKACTENLYSNCKNYLYKCNICPAGRGNEKSKLLYDPVDETIKHTYIYTAPPKKTIDKVKSTLVKKSLALEDKVVKSIAKKTIASGRVLHDGDLNILDRYKIEHKYRDNSKATFSIKSEEYNKMLRQNLNGLSITVKDKGTLYFLTEDTFTDLLALAKEALEFKIKTNNV